MVGFSSPKLVGLGAMDTKGCTAEVDYILARAGPKAPPFLATSMVHPNCHSRTKHCVIYSNNDVWRDISHINFNQHTIGQHRTTRISFLDVALLIHPAAAVAGAGPVAQ